MTNEREALTFRVARNLCQVFAESGMSAAECVQALDKLAAGLSQPPAATEQAEGEWRSAVLYAIDRAKDAGYVASAEKWQAMLDAAPSHSEPVDAARVRAEAWQPIETAGVKR